MPVPKLSTSCVDAWYRIRSQLMKHKRQELQESAVVLYARTQKLSDFMLLYVSLIGLSSLGAVAKIRAPSKRCFNIKIFNDTKRRAVSLRQLRDRLQHEIWWTAYKPISALLPVPTYEMRITIRYYRASADWRLSVRDVPVLDENSLTYCHSFFTVR